MPPKDEVQPREVSFAAIDGISIALLTGAIYVYLMIQYPIIYGGDTIARLVNPSRILSGHQLPLLQALIHFALQLHSGPYAIFLLMAIISAIACTGMYAIALILTGSRRAGWLAAIFYIAHPFILYYSRVPYQEPLLMAGVAWGFYFLFRSKSQSSRMLAALFFAFACFSRYEGWVAALIAAVFDIRQKRETEGKVSFRSFLESLLLFGWAPAAWILWNRDLSPAGTYVLDLALQWGRLFRPYFIVKSTLWWTESAMALLALIGIIFSLADPRMRQGRKVHALLAMVALLLVVLIFSGHGIDPDAIRIVTEREAFIPVGVLILFAAIGGNWLMERMGEICTARPSIRIMAATLALCATAGYSLDSGFHRIAMANADPEIKTDYEIARFLAKGRSGGLILAAPLPEGPMRSYVESVERWSGASGRRKAAELLAQAETTPLDYQRVLAYSWLGKERLYSGDQLKGLDCQAVESFLSKKSIDFIVVYSDFAPSTELDKKLLSCCVAKRLSLFEIRNDRKAGRIYPVHSQSTAAVPAAQAQ